MEILVSAVVGIATIIGLWQWRKEIKYRARFELARKICLLAYESQSNFQRARSPLTYPGNFADRPSSDDKSPEDKHNLDAKYARLSMLEPFRNNIAQFYALNWEADIILNQDFQPHIAAYQKAYGEVLTAIHCLYSIEHRTTPPIFVEDENKLPLPTFEGVNKATAEEVHEWRLTVYGRGDKDDSLSHTVNQATSEIVETLRRYFK